MQQSIAKALLLARGRVPKPGWNFVRIYSEHYALKNDNAWAAPADIIGLAILKYIAMESEKIFSHLGNGRSYSTN